MRLSPHGKPNNVALLSDDKEVSYSDLESRISELLRQFDESEITPGHRVAIHMDLSVDYVVLVLALIRHGVMACPLSTRSTEKGVDIALSTLGADVLFSAESPTIPVRIDHPSKKVDGLGGSVAIFTSGSTGMPKAAVLSESNLMNSARAANARLAFDSSSSWLLSLPIFHVGGLGIVLRAMQSGGTVVIPDASASLEDSLDKHGPSHVSLVSTQLHRLLKKPSCVRVLSECRCVLMGGSAMPKGLIDRAKSVGIPVHTSYGMTETAALMTSTTSSYTSGELSTSGSPLQDDSVRINSDGCIEVGGRSRFQGYLVNGTLEAPFTEDGWFTTRDRGAFTDSGFLQVFGRVDNMFVSGGENIQPETIEHALGQIDGILRSVVVPVEDIEFGQRPVAFVDVPGKKFDVIAVENHLRESLPGFMIPKCFYPWPETEAGTDMKIDRSDWIVKAQKLSDSGKAF